MRRLLRIILWMVKGTLLLIALAALVMWPVSRDREFYGLGQRYLERTGTVERIWFWGGASNGRSQFGFGWGRYSDAKTKIRVRQRIDAAGEGWRFFGRSHSAVWYEAMWPSRWGPLRWDVEHTDDQQTREVYARYAAPCWLVALVAGAWPLPSITFALRHRIKGRRAAGKGLCQSCGYDLRATPAAGGALLAVCPECGKESSTRNTPPPLP